MKKQPTAIVMVGADEANLHGLRSLLKTGVVHAVALHNKGEHVNIRSVLDFKPSQGRLVVKDGGGKQRKLFTSSIKGYGFEAAKAEEIKAKAAAKAATDATRVA